MLKLNSGAGVATTEDDAYEDDEDDDEDDDADGDAVAEMEEDEERIIGDEDEGHKGGAFCRDVASLGNTPSDSLEYK